MIRGAGWLLSAAAVVFLFIVARARWGEVSAISITSGHWALTGGLAAAYGLSLMLLAAAWHLLLRFAGASALPLPRSIYVFSTSQLAKYVPGNVFHFVGRHMMMRSERITDRTIAAASMIEIASMLLGAGVVVAAAALLHSPSGAGDAHRLLARYLPFAYLLGLGSVLLALRWLRVRDLRFLLAAFVLHLGFFLLMGTSIAALSAPLTAASPVPLAGGGVSAWIAGFVTPGAPAGVGVREAAMLLFAGDWLTPAKLLVIVALFRIVTFAGDLIFFALGWTLFRGR